MSLVFVDAHVGLHSGGEGGRHGFCVDDRVGDGGGEEFSESSSLGGNEESSVSSLSSSLSSKTEEDEVQSKLQDSPLGSLASLEDSLPINCACRRGLSSFFNGKSKSFQSLSFAAEEATAASELAKPENPFNKRRRILMACKSSWRRRASCTSLVNTSSLPGLHSLEEEEEDEEQEKEEKMSTLSVAPLPPVVGRMVRKKTTFETPRCFSP